ncbi:hypothetical protein NEDG_01159 [Nematocida displodere]|uniref:Uncharacterized protein n=1 Tax=Nematocida displodere TaxID=1805483 RepID=A0A177ECA4_9MICR|nr:hypothetical protein NEDG_01159 [Nematocida displodere]
MNDGISFQKVEVLLRIPLLPAQLANISEGIFAFLNLFLGEYIKQFKGLVICYSEEIALVDGEGVVIGGDPRTYFKVKVEFLILKMFLHKVSYGYLESATETECELSSFGVIAVRIPHTGPVASGLHKYMIKDIDIKTPRIIGAFIE